MAVALVFGAASLGVAARAADPLRRTYSIETWRASVRDVAAGARIPSNRLTLEGRLDRARGVRVDSYTTRAGSQIVGNQRVSFVYPLVQPEWRRGDAVFVFVRTAPLDVRYAPGEGAAAETFTGIRTPLDARTADLFVGGGVAVGERAFVLDLDADARGDSGEALAYLLALAALVPLAAWFLVSALHAGAEREPALVRFARGEALATARWFLLGASIAALITLLATEGNALDAPAYKTMTGAAFIALSLWGFVQTLRAPPEADERVQALCRQAQMPFPELARWLDEELDGAPLERHGLRVLRTTLVATGGPQLIRLVPLDDVVRASEQRGAGDSLVVIDHVTRSATGAVDRSMKGHLEHRLPPSEAARIIDAIVARRPDVARGPSPAHGQVP